MAILKSYLSVTSTATPISPDSATPPVPDPIQTKILLPKKKPMKWSTGVAPGDYGGPPTTTKLRKYWGGEDDPLTSDDFIWNREFMDRMKNLIQEPNSSIQSTPAKWLESNGVGAENFGSSNPPTSKSCNHVEKPTTPPSSLAINEEGGDLQENTPMLKSLLVQNA